MLEQSEKIDNERAVRQAQDAIAVLKDSISYDQYRKILSATNNFSDNEKTLEIISAMIEKGYIDAKNRKHLLRLIGLNKTAKNLNPIELVAEQRKLTEQIKFALAYNDTEAQITFISDFSKYFGEFLNASLMQDDWQYVKDAINAFKEIYAKYASYNYLKDIEEDIKEITKYYDINTQRNEIFLENIFKNSLEFPPAAQNAASVPQNAADLLSKAQDVKIVITGGYHSEGLKELFEKNNVSLIVITPNVAGEVKESQKIYEEIIKRQGAMPSQALSYILTSNLSEQNQIPSIIGALRALGKTDDEIQSILGNQAKISDYQIPSVDAAALTAAVGNTAGV